MHAYVSYYWRIFNLAIFKPNCQTKTLTKVPAIRYSWEVIYKCKWIPGIQGYCVRGSSHLDVLIGDVHEFHSARFCACYKCICKHSHRNQLLENKVENAPCLLFFHAWPRAEMWPALPLPPNFFMVAIQQHGNS